MLKNMGVKSKNFRPILINQPSQGEIKYSYHQIYSLDDSIGSVSKYSKIRYSFSPNPKNPNLMNFSPNPGTTVNTPRSQSNPQNNPNTDTPRTHFSPPKTRNHQNLGNFPIVTNSQNSQTGTLKNSKNCPYGSQRRLTKHHNRRLFYQGSKHSSVPKGSLERTKPSS